MDTDATEPRTTQQWLAEGRTPADLRRPVAAGELVHLRRGAYVQQTAKTKEERHRQLIDATAPGLTDAVLSHYSAAVVHGLLLPHGPSQEVQVIRSRTSRGGGTKRGPLHVHVARLPPEDITMVDGLAVTTRARTLVDLACRMTFDAAVVTLDAGLRHPEGRGRESAAMRQQVEAVLSRMGRVPGIKKARDAVAFADGRAESPLESRSQLVLWREGIAPPELQYVVRDQSGREIARLDFAWPEHKVYGECDGKVKYTTLLRDGETPGDVVMREKRRDNLLTDLGWRAVRWQDLDLQRPKVLAGRVRRALAGA
ncbi:MULTISPECIES: hypothetical protein [unclassified Luteococcus]|uniref:hypothetical protein n=1 Tax=unclassified Luteococcus TaxID=2639923 RepID=UPI00313C73CE